MADENLVSIFQTDDQALLPLATMALEAEGIEYSVRSVGKVDSMRWMMSQSPTNRAEVTEILVAADVAARARDLVVDLERPMGASSSDPATIGEGSDPPAIQLENVATGITIGTITEEQLQELTSHLEEDGTPQQYLIDDAAIDVLQEAHADAALVALLRQAVGDTSGPAIRWVVR